MRAVFSQVGIALHRASARWAVLGLVALLAACASHRPLPLATAPGLAHVPPGLAQERLARVSWAQVSGWPADSLIGVTGALKQTCSRLGATDEWRRACSASADLDELDADATRKFFEEYFTPFQLANANGSVDGLVTGYYEPLLHGSRTRHPPYLYPLYRMPDRLRGQTSLPDRARLVRSGELAGYELVYVDDPIEAFFLQVQGSGRIVLEDGSVMRVAYGGTNNKPYRSIGRWLIDQGEVSAAQATMQGIKAWARQNPNRVEALLDVNPRFVFFKEAGGSAPIDGHFAEDGPIGALGVPLTPERSIAVDPSAIPLGMPVFLSTTRPSTNVPLERLVFAQDVGSAIRGGVRADYFWGLGDAAGDMAGRMKQSGRMWLLLPN
ncbi:MAG: murein transglycosylase A [Janthinobacterium lividum]